MTPATADAINRLLPRLREEYPGTPLGILGRVNQAQGAMCPCGSHDLIVVWAKTPIKICPHCKGEFCQLSLPLEGAA